MSLTVSSKPGANVLSLDFAFASSFVSTALSPVSITFSSAISAAASFEFFAPCGPIPKPEDPPPFDVAVPLDEDEFVEEASVLEEPEALVELVEPAEPLDGKPDAPAESRALAPTLVSVTL